VIFRPDGVRKLTQLLSGRAQLSKKRWQAIQKIRQKGLRADG
jgi:hypothetical protein